MDSSDSYKESVPGGGGGWGWAVLSLYGLNGDVPLDRVWFSSSLSQTGYVILRGSEFVLNRISNFTEVCPKQGNEFEGFVLNRVCILELFLALTDQDFKPSAAHLACK